MVCQLAPNQFILDDAPVIFLPPPVRGAVPLWYEPPGMAAAQCKLAYRAVNTPGGIWAGGPTSIAESCINLPTPGIFDLTELYGLPPGWAAVTGWSIGGLPLDTGYTPPADQGQTLIIEFRNQVNTPLCGTPWGVGTCLALLPNLALYVNGGFQASAAYITGNAAVSGNQGYKNGLSDGAAIGAWTGPATGPLLVGSCVGWGDYIGDIWALALYRPALTLAQLQEIVLRMGQL
jgi:hypothetical protein